ncbi:syntaxin binding protein 6 (amisyn), like isoform X2 [Salminus brasiliensis]|uniref:syntaxin binding protein 6 (amisyn), like isoform X2 n=1 Tax=Salminus brasiliensis TaxID=930266 RepID=UPI003B82FD7C
MMNIQSAISREIFAPQDEKLLVAIEVNKRKKRRLPFLTAGRKRDYVTFLCLSVTNKRPAQVFITKVKQYPGSPRFAKRSQWSVSQLRRVDGINPNKDTPEFDLGFDHNYDQWVAGSAAEKCMFVQILYHACQNYWEGRLGLGAAGDQKGPATSGDQPAVPGPVERKKVPAPRPTEFVNCQSKLMGDACSVNMVIYRCKIFLNRMKNTMIASQSQLQIAGLRERSVGSVVRRASQVLTDRGDFRIAKQVAKPRSLP